MALKDCIDLILSDVVLPDGSGVEFVDWLVARSPQIPAILSSGYADEKSKFELVAERDFTFLQKPYTIDKLLRAIKVELGKTGRDPAARSLGAGVG